MNDLYDKEYFNKQSLEYAFTEERRKIFQYHLNTLLSMKGKIKTILDVGCGFGYFLSLCDKAGLETYGLEISDYAINEAKKNTKAKIQKVRGKMDNKNAPFANRKFDVVTAFDVVEHLDDDREMLEFAYDRLRKGGIFYGTTPNAKFALNYFLKEQDLTHINVHGASYWLTLLRDIGFRDLRMKYIFSFGFPPLPILRAKMGIVWVKPIFTPFELLGQEILFVAKNNGSYSGENGKNN